MHLHEKMKPLYYIQITAFAILTIVASYFYVNTALSLTEENESKKMIGQLLLFAATLSAGYIMYLYQSNDQRKRDMHLSRDAWERQKNQQSHESFENFKKI